MRHVFSDFEASNNLLNSLLTTANDIFVAVPTNPIDTKWGACGVVLINTHGGVSTHILAIKDRHCEGREHRQVFPRKTIDSGTYRR